jgi:phosphonate metabolism protein PhnN/1,5-bisphosphokinase (PRPP-forming)
MLFLVVGPSGAGKDTLMDGVRAALAGDHGFRPGFRTGGIRFVRRVITRPPGPGEDHEPVTADEFVRRREAGGFALHWNAHGLDYGIPADIADDLRTGRVVVANVSRGVIAQAAACFQVVVLQITAPPAVLAGRLAGRGRETPAKIADRLAREVALPEGVAVQTVVNDDTPERGVAAILALLRAPRPA